jgi:hypothetical protein
MQMLLAESSRYKEMQLPSSNPHAAVRFRGQVCLAVSRQLILANGKAKSESGQAVLPVKELLVGQSVELMRKASFGVSEGTMFC